MVDLTPVIVESLQTDILDISELQYEAEPNIWLPVFTVHIEPSLEQDSSKVGIESWQITNF